MLPYVILAALLVTLALVSRDHLLPALASGDRDTFVLEKEPERGGPFERGIGGRRGGRGWPLLTGEAARQAVQRHRREAARARARGADGSSETPL